jgi:predicted Zn-dependent protease
MAADLDKALQLYNLQKYDLALREINELLGTEPRNARAIALRSHIFMEQNKPADALSSALEAVSLDPEDDYLHYVLCLAYIEVDKDHDAERVITEAIRLDPGRPHYYELLAAIKCDFKKYKEGLEICRKGLSIDPQHKGCLRVQARILAKMGQNKEAYSSIRQAMQKDPENVQTLASSGWVHLESGDHKQALEDFKEALRLQPGYEHAREGLLQALKSKYILYRIFINYINWFNRLNSAIRIGFTLLLLLVFRIAGGPGLYALFILSLWLVSPIFNTVLFFDKFGRYTLTRGESICSITLTSFLILYVLSLIAFYIFHQSYISIISFSCVVIAILLALLYRRLVKTIDTKRG